MCGVGKFVPFWIARAWVYPRMCGVGRDDPFSRVLLKVYPRVCGVGPYPDMIPPSEYGLSPHVRGRLDQASPVPALFGGYPRVYGVGSLVFTVFEFMREPYMQIAYLFPELIVH